MSGWATITVVVRSETYTEQIKEKVENMMNEDSNHYIKIKGTKVYGKHYDYSLNNNLDKVERLAKNEVVEKVAIGSSNDTGDVSNQTVISYHRSVGNDFGSRAKKEVLEQHGFNPFTGLEHQYDEYPEWPMFVEDDYSDYEVLKK